MGQGATRTHLLQRGVLDSVGIVVIVDDLEVSNSRARPRPHEPHVQGGLPCPPCLHAEVGGGPHLHPCTTSSSHCRTHGTHRTHSPCPTAPRSGWASPPPPIVSHCRTHGTHSTCLTAPITPTPRPPPHPTAPGPSPVRLSPGPSALTLVASWDGSTLMRKGLEGISWEPKPGHSDTVAPQGRSSSPTWPLGAGGTPRSGGWTLRDVGQSQNPHLVGEEHHDGVEPRARRCVLDREGVIVILNYVKVDVRLERPHHSRGALDANADVTCGVGWVSGTHSQGGHRGVEPGTWGRGLDQDWG